MSLMKRHLDESGYFEIIQQEQQIAAQIEVLEAEAQELERKRKALEGDDTNLLDAYFGGKLFEKLANLTKPTKQEQGDYPF